ncbi:TPA: PagK family vesicle-borne virulence factor [Salmonella enterica]
MKNRIFLPLLLVLSATAFSASAMAASDSKPPPDNTKHSYSGWPPLPAQFIRPPFCDKWPDDILKPPDFCDICGC